MHVPAPLPAGGAPQRPCASVPLTPALSPKRAVAAPLQATDHLSNPAPTALPTAARGGSARMDGTAWRVGTGGGALQVRPPNGRGRGEQTSPPHGGGERRFRATGACRLQVRQAECFFNVQLIMYVRRTQPQFHFPWESSCWPGVGVPTGIHKSSWGGPAAPWLLGPAVVCCVPAVPPPRRGRTGTGVPMPAASAGVRHRHRHPKPPRHQHGGTVRGD
jgi:hypothetical protein